MHPFSYFVVPLWHLSKFPCILPKCGSQNGIWHFRNGTNQKKRKIKWILCSCSASNTFVTAFLLIRAEYNWLSVDQPLRASQWETHKLGNTLLFRPSMRLPNEPSEDLGSSLQTFQSFISFISISKMRTISNWLSAGCCDVRIFVKALSNICPQ